MDDAIVCKDGDFGIDLESGMHNCTSEQVGSINGEGRNVLNSIGVSVNNLNMLIDNKLEGEEMLDNYHVEKKSAKEKRKKTSNKKAPKPPRPPRGPSLDAADQKLIREISELAMLKRARVERIKALKKMKAAKPSPSSSGSNLFAMVLTIIFCVVILCQGISSKSSSPSSFHLSVGAPAGTDNSFISVQYQIASVNASNGSFSGSPSLVEQVSGLDPQANASSVAE